MDTFEEIIMHYGEEPANPEVDKEFRNVISYVQSLNAHFQENQLPMAHGDLRGQVQEVNRRWKNYLTKKGEVVACTGEVYLGASYVETDSSIDEEFVDYTNEFPIDLVCHPVVNVGFAAYDNIVYDDDGNLTGEQRIVYTAMLAIETDDDEAGESSIRLAVIDPEDILIPSAYDVYSSVDAALSPMQQRHYKYVRHLLDTSTDPCETTLLLKDAVLVVSEYDALEDESDRQQSDEYRNHLNNLFEQAVRFEHNYPYIAEIQGEISERLSGRASEHTPAYIAQRTKVLINDPELTAEWDSDGICKLMLKAQLTGSRLQSVIRIPLQSLVNVESTKPMLDSLLLS